MNTNLPHVTRCAHREYAVRDGDFAEQCDLTECRVALSAHLATTPVDGAGLIQACERWLRAEALDSRLFRTALGWRYVP